MNTLNTEETGVFLIGSSTFLDKGLSDLPAALNNISELKRIFFKSIGIPLENIKHKIDVKDKAELLIDIKCHATGKEYFFLYYSGHGILDDDDKLYFSLTNSTIKDICFNGISIVELNKSLDNTAKNIILIIDACFSEKAFKQINQRNYFVIASSSKTETSKYPSNENFSAFTKELIDVLLHGIDIDNAELNLNDVYRDIRRRLTLKNLPEPKLSSTNQLNELILLKNAYKNFRSSKERPIKLEPGIYHALPPAPRFVGREKELKHIYDFWNRQGSGVLSIEAIGGAGKTAIAQLFLSEIIENNLADGVFVWSFYDEPDTNLFFQYAYQYFSGKKDSNAKGYAWLHLLKEVIGSGKKNLLILDGLEKVQYEKNNFYSIYEHFTGKKVHAFGEIQDVLLRELLKRLASFGGNTKVIITTRFPVIDLQAFHDKTYFSLDLSLLDEVSAVSLLRKHNIAGSDQRLIELLRKYGTHALTIDHLGTLIERFYDGDSDKFTEIDNFSIRGSTSQARRLASIFKKYEELIPKFEKEVLGIICIFRVGVGIQLIIDVYKQFHKQNDNNLNFDIVEAVYSLVDYHLVLKDSFNNFTVHPAIRDHFYKIFTNQKQMHQFAYQSILTLTERPDSRIDTHSIEMLNNYEELIYHLLKSGDIENAKNIYFHRVGGYSVLADILGEFLRGYRILSQFPEIIDYDGWLKYRQGIGDMPTEKELKEISKNLKGTPHSYDTALLYAGKLIEADKKQVSAASFLIGKQVNTIYGTHDAAPKFSAYFFSNTYDNINDRYGNKAVKLFLYAEINRKNKLYKDAEIFLRHGETLILGSGSQPHLCIMHLVKSRFYIDTKHYKEAYSNLFEGLEIARNSKFRVFEIDLMIEQARYYLEIESYNDCLEISNNAFLLSVNEDIKYVWGGGYALLYHLKCLRLVHGKNSLYFKNAKSNLKQKLNIFYSIPLEIASILTELTSVDLSEEMVVHDNLLGYKKELQCVGEDYMRLYAESIRVVDENSNLTKLKSIYEEFLTKEYIAEDVINLYEVYNKLNIYFDFNLFLNEKSPEAILHFANYFFEKRMFVDAVKLSGELIKRIDNEDDEDDSFFKYYLSEACFAHSWYCLFVGYYDESINTINRILKKENGKTLAMLHAIRICGHLLKDDFSTAKKTYERYENTTYDGLPFKKILLSKFSTLLNNKIRNQNLDLMIELINND